ncbi:MAG TPA: NTP transferase domain-containing protein [Geminicoccaceae bacterium]|nr:NTP transferase domain-containing protein [Geminicoccaceae bacterium]
MTAACHALVLAASRPQDPLARHAGKSHKALVRVAGDAMLLRVLRALRQSRGVGPIAVCLEADAPVAGAEPELDRLVADGAVTLIAAAASPAQSVLRALEILPLPLLVTTADHPLLSAAMVESFCAAAPADAAAAVAVVRASLLQQRYRDAVRTYYRFAGEGYSGCNLFLLRSPEAPRAVRFWAGLERHRKQPWRLVASVGPLALLRFLLGRLSLDGAMRHLSAKAGATIRAVELPFPEAAIDVDKPADLELAEKILARRAAAGQGGR